MGYSEQILAPCRTCRVMQKHDCQFQEICTKVKEYRHRNVIRQLDGQTVERVVVKNSAAANIREGKCDGRSHLPAMRKESAG